MNESARPMAGLSDSWPAFNLDDFVSWLTNWHEPARGVKDDCQMNKGSVMVVSLWRWNKMR
jgi:hypothetical protein